MGGACWSKSQAAAVCPRIPARLDWKGMAPVCKLGDWQPYIAVTTVLSSLKLFQCFHDVVISEFGEKERDCGSLKFLASMGHKKSGRKTHVLEDQYGESMVSQDRDIGGFSGKTGSSGGNAGGGTRKGVQLVRHVPKFLQKHAHLLANGASRTHDEDVGKIKIESRDKSVGEDEEEERKEALLRALEENPSIVEQFPEMQEMQKSAEAEKIKVKGNEAFQAGKMEEAARLFEEAILMNPR